MKTDVVIVGGGPAGAATAMYLKRQGIPSVIIEQETFPRYHIGESMTGECGGILRKLGFEDKMVAARHPVKHGVKVYGKGGKHTWFLPTMMRTAEGQLAPISTWQVRRADFDKMMLDEAIVRGADVIWGRATKPIMGDDGAVRGVEVKPSDGGTMQIESQMLFDCTGQATWLGNLGYVTGPKYLGAYDKQVAFFSQVSGAIRDNEDAVDSRPGNTLIFYKDKYHWSWFIPIDDEVVSVGIVGPSAYFRNMKERKKDFLIRELHELNPEMARRIPEITLVEDVHVIPNYSFQVRRFCGKGFICIGDSHRFIDPIFSFGLWVAIKEADIVAPQIKAYLEGANRDAANPFADYQLYVEKGIDVLEDVIDLFWEQPFAFAQFVHQRYREPIIDVFAGRIYEGQPSPAVQVFRKMLGREREREYENGDAYSVPVGSRFHAERAPLWEPGSEDSDLMEDTEAWMGAR